jgi:F-type H+-transporting ATPase subunit a
MYPKIFIQTFTLLAEANVGKHFYWNIAGSLVHGQVLLVIWFVVAVLLLLALGTSNADRIPHGFQNFMEAAVDFVTDIAKDQLGESFIKNGFHLLEHYSSLFSDVIGLVQLYRGN